MGTAVFLLSLMLIPRIIFSTFMSQARQRLKFISAVSNLAIMVVYTMAISEQWKLALCDLATSFPLKLGSVFLFLSFLCTRCQSPGNNSVNCFVCHWSFTIWWWCLSLSRPLPPPPPRQTPCFINYMDFFPTTLSCASSLVFNIKARLFPALSNLPNILRLSHQCSLFSV